VDAMGTIKLYEDTGWIEDHLKKARESAKRNPTKWKEHHDFSVNPLWKRCYAGREEVVLK